MSTQEEIREEIRLLKVREQTEGTSKELDNRIASENNKLTALIQSQQGNFSSSHHIFPLLFPNLLDVTLCPITLDISSSPILVMQIRKVRDDYLDNYLVSGFITVKPLIVRKSHFISLFLSFFFTITR